MLAFAVRVGRISDPVDIQTLRASALGALHAFVREAQALELPADALALSRAAAAALLDDAVLGTAWGSGDWEAELVVSAIAPEFTGTGFHDGVDRQLEEPSAPRAVLELVYLCLSLGLSGRCWSLSDAAARRDALRERLWRVLGGADATNGLSPEWAGLAMPAVAPSRSPSDWLASLLRRPTAGEAALIDGMTRDPDGDAADVERQVFRERFAEGMSLVAQYLRRKGQSLTRLPWYAVIGAPGTGMMSALRNSGLEFPLHDHSFLGTLQGVGGTRHCEFCLTDRAMFLDTVGRLVVEDAAAARYRAEWLAFLALLKRTRPSQPVNGVILAVSIVDLLHATAEHRRMHAAALRARLVEFQDGLRTRLPVYMLITKLDLLVGFVEFFDALDRREREQVLGFSLPLEPDEAGAAARWQIQPRFERLIEHQRRLMIDRLWFEPDPRRRALIHEFPAQLASVGRVLDDFAGQVFDNTDLALPLLPRGLYFTSSMQEGRPIDRWLPVIAATMGMAPSPPAEHRGEGRAFFLHRLYGALMPGEAGLVAALAR